MKHLKLVVLTALLCWSFGIAAETQTAPVDLPPEALVRASLEAHPMVRAARARLDSAEAGARRLRAGSHEYQARAGYQRRNDSSIGGGNFNEWELALERGLRLPAKKRLDGELGVVLGEEAEERVGEARHETARELLRLWYAALQGAAAERLWARQSEVLVRQVSSVEKRVKAGDAAAMERPLAQAALLQSRSEQARSKADAARAVAELAARFPELPAPGNDSETVPVLIGDAPTWVAAAMTHNHELAALEKAAELARLGARRSQAELTPDPILGLRLASERDGREHIAGLTLSLPLPGEGRRAQVAAGQASAAALAEDEAAARRRIVAETAAGYEQARSALLQYQARTSAMAQLREYADLAWRAYQLGESGLADALNARKAALEAERESIAARLAASEAVARLMLDTHQLWLPTEAAGHHR